ncbi:MAG TPA: hypothetical protein VMS21_10270, partial [Methylomirabilota bacterium]|nr:hypothetical protein [Methylomirabilota bacterium]
SGELLNGTYSKAQIVWKTYGKFDHITVPSPVDLFVMMDEHPDSINDAGLAVQCAMTGRSARIIDFPASYHNGAVGVTFADGHAEIKKWVDDRTKPPAMYTGSMALNVASPNNPDVDWMQQRTSARR